MLDLTIEQSQQCVLVLHKIYCISELLEGSINSIYWCSILGNSVVSATFFTMSDMLVYSDTRGKSSASEDEQ